VGKTTDVLLPDIGDFESVEVIEILVSEGDEVSVDDSLVTLESDKATMEIPSPHSGKVKRLLVKVGARISEGDKILTIELSQHKDATEAPPSAGLAPAAEELETVQAPAPSPAEHLMSSSDEQRRPGDKEVQIPPVPNDPSNNDRGIKPHASPSVRRLARELGVDLTLVEGRGPKQRILKDDVHSFVKQSLRRGEPGRPMGGESILPAAPDVDYSRFGDVVAKPLSRIKKISGEHLHRCWLSVPHVTQFDEADITELEAFRKSQKESAQQRDIRLTLMPFLMKSVAVALYEMPRFNASLDREGEALIYRKYVHIGVAVDTPNGLVVPVIRDVDQKGIYELAQELMSISNKAREGKLTPADIQGGCFSISSLGGIGGTAFTPIVNAPEVAILGVSRSVMRPVWDGGAFQPRLMLPLSLSYDHRVIDGAEGVRFTRLLTLLLGDIRKLLM
jgi:pyruvate dehydrogenase E2 component (dihydrolipoamide acetyltransferase)